MLCLPVISNKNEINVTTHVQNSEFRFGTGVPDIFLYPMRHIAFTFYKYFKIVLRIQIIQRQIQT